MREETTRIERACLGAPLSLEAHLVGEDIAVLIVGGTRPHVGAVSAAFYQNGAADVHTAQGEGHRDGVVSEAAARRICEALHRNCTVCCGIHYDNASKEDIRRILRETDAMLETLLARLNASSPRSAGGIE